MRLRLGQVDTEQDSVNWNACMSTILMCQVTNGELSLAIAAPLYLLSPLTTLVGHPLCAQVGGVQAVLTGFRAVLLLENA